MQNTTNVQSKPTVNKYLPLIVVGAVLVGLIVGFTSGTFYQKAQAPNGNSRSPLAQSGQNSSRFDSQFGGGGRNFGGQRRLGGNGGEVTAVDSNSLTTKNARTGESKTYSIGSDTVIIDQGQTTTLDTIKTGDQVTISVSASDASHAVVIQLVPGLDTGMPGSLN